ncbi:MAG: hypothetical protein COA57_00970 [Flavobacteriales bacterium]|nr:MAG: hypothetical protein COA57_00970 [Flavobacteriales bacterium]
MNPLVSIIIPAYNAEKYIAETIQSVINQTYTNWELIIVNDGSTDNTEKIAQAYVEKDQRIKYIYQENAGVSVARNKGVENSQGDYVAFLDADDIWCRQNLEKKVTILNNINIDWVYSDMLSIDKNGNQLQYPEVGKNYKILENILLWNGEVVPGPGSNIITKKKCFDEGVIFDPNFSTAADQDFTIQLASKYQGKRIPEKLWYYRVIASSMSRNMEVMEKDHIGVYKKAAKNNLFKSFWFKQKCFSNLYLILAGSWWKDGNNKSRGLSFIFKSLIIYPPNIIKLVAKLI